MTQNQPPQLKQTELGLTSAPLSAGIPEDWEVSKFNDILEITSSKRIFMSEYKDRGVPFYRGKEIIEKSKGNQISTDLYISEEKFSEIAKRFGAPQEADILLSSVGTLGVPYIVNKDERFYFKDGNITWFKNYSNRISPKFLYYWIISPNGKCSILGSSIGSTQQALTIESLKKTKISLPPISEQCQIASILSSLDDKIELNRKMNKTLENIAKAIFKRWFVDFEFPNSNGQPYKSSGGKMIDSELGQIPEGWRIDNIYQIAKVKYGAPFSSKLFNKNKEGYPLIRIRDLKTLNPEFYTTENHPNGFLVKPGDIIVGMDAEFTPWIWFGIQSLVNQRVCVFEPIADYVHRYYIYSSIQPYLKYYENGKVGTTVIHLSKSDIDHFQVTVPLKSIMYNFNEITEPIFNKLIINAQQNQTLSHLRDLLLPRLMSGRIRVE